MARSVELCVRHSPPAPRNVGRPDEADRPAPSRARTRLDFVKCSWKDLMSSSFKDVGDAGECVIVDSFRRRETVRKIVVSLVADRLEGRQLLLDRTRHVKERGRNGCMKYLTCQPRWHELRGCFCLETGVTVYTSRARITSPTFPCTVWRSDLIRVVASSVDLLSRSRSGSWTQCGVAEEAARTDRVHVRFLDRNADGRW